MKRIFANTSPRLDLVEGLKKCRTWADPLRKASVIALKTSVNGKLRQREYTRVRRVAYPETHRGSPFFA